MQLSTELKADLSSSASVGLANAPAEFASIDSAPKLYAKTVSPWRAPLLLLVFALLSGVQVYGLHQTSFGAYFPQGDYVPSGLYTGQHSIAFRVFSFTFLITFSLFWADSWRRRLSLVTSTAVAYLAACLMLDAILAISGFFGMSHSMHLVELLSGLLGFAIFSLALLENGAMPPEIVIRQRGRRVYSTQLLVVVGLVVIAGWLALSIDGLQASVVEFLRSIALLGGIGPGVFLILPLFFTLLFVFAHLRRSFLKRADFMPDVTVIIPAYNEEYIITRTIEALDKSAEGYRGRVNVKLVDNNSKDATAALAREAFEKCTNIIGRVIKEPRAGKSFALNNALNSAGTDFLIRVDADTQVQPGALARAMSWFADPRVGVVGGLPIVPNAGPFDRARQIETLVKHGFYSIALEAIGGVVGIPGMFAVYRTRHLRALGGFVSGMNGEDTDISLRIAERGHRMVVDAQVLYISEVPATYGHMREQRLRWFRSVFHISSRSRQLMLGAKASFRGRLILPFMLVNSSRRAMMVPLILFGAVELFWGSGQVGLLRWQEVIAVMLGTSILIAAMAAVVNGRSKALLGMPDYICFRFLRSYFTLESMLTILVLPQRHKFRLRGAEGDLAKMRAR